MVAYCDHVYVNVPTRRNQPPEGVFVCQDELLARTEMKTTPEAGRGIVCVTHEALDLARDALRSLGATPMRAGCCFVLQTRSTSGWRLAMSSMNSW